ncbi:MAG: HDOD domain-containing protein [Opitutales bacterium]|nr:HDOD domain-containing protein [Opitutales bacterium]
MRAEDVISQVEKLPPAPAVLPTLLNLLRDTNSDPGEIISLIRMDPSLTAQVLRLSNSVYYAMSTPSCDLEDAVARIGFREVYKLVAMVCGQQLFNHSIQSLFLGKGELWEYSLATGYIMEQMATDLGMDSVTCYTAGLLHSLGKLIITAHPTMDYADVFRVVEARGISIAQAEREIWGVTNSEVAATLLRQWKFRDEIVIPIEYHTCPAQAPKFRKQACMMHLSIWTVASLGLNYGKDAWAMEASPYAMHHIGIPEERMQVFMVNAHEKLAMVKELLVRSESV